MDLFNTLIHRLNTGAPTIVEFSKLNGEVRTMNASWGEKGTIDGPGRVRVFDTEVCDYRCIRSDSILSVR